MTEDNCKEKVRLWTDADIVQSLRKWNRHRTKAYRAATQVMVKMAHLKPGMRILDLATGAGDPALTLAEALGARGEVTGVDKSQETLSIAADSARQRCLTNIKFITADAHNLPLGDGYFDLITCRFGIMFFEECQKALRESLRVLKSGGGAIYMAWGPPEKQEHYSAIFKSSKAYIHDLMQKPGVATPYKFAGPGRLSSALRKARFSEIKEENLTLLSQFPGSPEENWEYSLETLSSFRPIREKLTEEQRKQVRRDFLTALTPRYDGENLNLAIEVVLATGLG